MVAPPPGNSPPPLDLSRAPPPEVVVIVERPIAVESVLIPFDSLPDAVRHYLWANAPHMLDFPCRYTMLRDGSLLVEALPFHVEQSA